MNASNRSTFLPLILFTCSLMSIAWAQQQDPMTMNGGSLLAMAGKDCVAIALDKRFGSGPQMVNIAPRLAWTPNPQLMVAFVGLEGDVQSLSQDLQTQVRAKLNRALGFSTSLQEDSRRRYISPKALASITSHMLHRNRGRYYVEPVIAGLSTSSSPSAPCKPFLCAMDMIGAKSTSQSFVCSGAASKSLYGTAEALWKPDMDKDQLLRACGEAFQSALERDCLSGYGSLVYLITKDGITEYDLAHRND
ncbi:unnamed protein product [Cylindrotheca closterium]|uniref:Proteasome subunit beta n=1 Tax=Cylindrotheca closterium TaxID=2856 RepID=A0AAD2D1D4_9STRA|nr:unnamed protein product [Cylindrotheca closterium]